MRTKATHTRPHRRRLRVAASAGLMVLALISCPVGRVHAACTATCEGSDFARLSLAIEVHVENRLLGTADEAAYVQRIAAAATAAGVPLTFALGVDLLDDHASGVDSSTGLPLPSSLAELVAALQDDCCHRVTLHADVPEELPGEDIPAYLAPYLAQLGAAGADTSVASGVCNEVGGRFGWVEAARDAGLAAVAGVVEYCQGSLRPSHADWIDPTTCTPTTCHDAAPVDDPAQRVATWHTRRTRRWIVPLRVERSTDLVVLGGMGAGNFPCLGEAAGGRPSCSASGYTGAAAAVGDVAAFVSSVAGAQDSYRSGGTGDVVYVTFSTNAVADDAWLAAMFAGIQSELANRTDATGTALSELTQWSTLPAIAAANR